MGKILVTADGEYITGIYFEGQKYFPKDLSGSKMLQSEVIRLVLNLRQPEEYFAGERTAFDLPLLQPSGTPFQRRRHGFCPPQDRSGKDDCRHWRHCQQSRETCRLAGSGSGRWPQPLISVVIPCHRVVGASGSLTGYAGGLQRKKSAALVRGQNTGPSSISFFLC